MDPVIKAKWLEALRSGKYKQGKGRLRVSLSVDGDKFCCLGVLADIVRPDDWSAGRARDAYSTEWSGSQKRKVYFHQGEEVQPSCLLHDITGLRFYEADRLATMNDEGETFEAIADVIEKEL